MTTLRLWQNWQSCLDRPSSGPVSSPLRARHIDQASIQSPPSWSWFQSARKCLCLSSCFKIWTDTTCELDLHSTGKSPWIWNLDFRDGLGKDYQVNHLLSLRLEPFHCIGFILKSCDHWPLGKISYGSDHWPNHWGVIPGWRWPLAWAFERKPSMNIDHWGENHQSLWEN